jgi:hemerythrin
VKWKEEYATGVKEIDAQHKTLFASTEDFRQVLKQGCSADTFESFLEFLCLYTEVHFDYEEGCMLARNCPAACKNKKEHASLADFLQSELQFYRKNGFKPRRAVRLLEVIDRWLESHICRIDVQLRADDET